MNTTSPGAPVLYGWNRVNRNRYRRLVNGHVYDIIRNERPEADGYGPAGQVTWQIERDGFWLGCDPFATKREAVAYISEMERS
jgi:hypothetical protein